MSKILKDFTGREISVGDYVVVSKSTYSKTPYMDFGRVKEIEEEKAKDGSVKRFKVVYTLIATSKYSTIDIIFCKYNVYLFVIFPHWDIIYNLYFICKCYLFIIKHS